MAVLAVDGDPKLVTNGLSFDFADLTDGQPEMDTGLENAVTLSLFPAAHWWGNSITGPDEEIRGALDGILSLTLTNQTRLNVEAAASKGLAWMVSAGIAKKITVSATIPRVGWLSLAILIEQPGQTVTVRYQINWAQLAITSGVAA